MKYNRGAVLWACLALLILEFPFGSLATTYYTYDTLGRVTQVVESDGATTQYSYDANGNVTSINRIAGTSVLSIGSVSSSSGASGSSVTITGSGFSSIPGQDVVTFNGVAATVTYASGNRLVVTVPPGATTGDISITTSSNTVTSSNPFTVVPVSVTSFTPASGVAGTVLTVDGGGFDPTPANNTVSINGIPATVTSATTTQLQVTVPSGATPGHISVTSPLGSATGTGYFFIPAPGYTPSQIAEVVIEAPGVADVLPVNGANQVGVILFDGIAGQRFSMVPSNMSAEPGYTVFAPDGSTFANDLSPLNQEVPLAPLRQTGTYAWYYRPSSVPASATYQLVTDVLGQLSTDGTPTPTSLAPGQNATYTFAGTAGQFYNLTLPNFSSTGWVDASVYNPDGSRVIDCGAYQAYYNETQNCAFSVSATGIYTVRIVPMLNSLAPASFNTYVVQDFSATLTTGTPGPSVGVRLVPEQNGNLSFTATANQTLALYVAPLSDPSNDPMAFRVSGPGSVADNSDWLGNGTGHTFNLPNLVAGNYLVTLRPYNNGAAVTTTATLAQGVTGTLTTDGTSTTVQTYVPGQNVYLTFSGTQGQDLTLVLTQLSLTPTSVNSASVTVTNPDGSAYKSGTCYVSSTPGCTVSLNGLPQTGTYSVTVNPDGQATLGAALSLPSDVTGTLTLNNSTTVTLTSLGQQGEFTFVAVANEAVILSARSIATTPANTPMTFYVYNASGALVSQVSLSTDGTLNIGTLAAGTYSIVVAPNNAATGSVTVSIGSAQSTAVPTDGSSTNVTTNSPGENAYVTFQANAGDSVNVALNNLALNPTSPNSINWTVTAPDGSMVMNMGGCATNSPNNCSRGISILSQTGTYTVNVYPQAQQTLSFGVVVVKNIQGTITPGTNETLNLAELGQEAKLAVTAVAGQNLTVSVTGISTAPANVPVYIGLNTASGSYVTSTQSTSGAVLNMPNLAPGNYFLWIGPVTAATSTMQLSFQLSAPIVVPADGTSTTISTAAPGQSISLQFSATAGDSVNVAFTNLVVSPGSTDAMNWSVLAPDGSTVISSSPCTTSNPGNCRGGMVVVPQTGTYTVNITPQGLDTLSFLATVAHDLATTITPGTVETLNLNQIGENARFAFTLTAPESLSINLTGIATVPASGVKMYMSVNTINGTSVGYLASVNSSSESESLNVNLGPGNYILWIGPDQPATTTAQLSFQQSAPIVVPADGTSTTISTAAPGQSISLQFSATAGDSVNVAFTNLVVSPGSTDGMNWSVLAPDGSTVISSSPCTTSNPGNCRGGMVVVPQTGTYTVNITPQGPDTLSFMATVAHDLTTTITPGTVETLNLNQVGENARFAFTLTAPESLSINLTGIATVPASGVKMYMSVNTINGTSVGYLASVNSSSESESLNVNLGPGNYILWIGPDQPATTTAQLSFQ